MGYMIQYSKDKQYKTSWRKQPIAIFMGIVLLCVIVTAMIAFPDAITEIRRIVFPVLEPEVKEAFQHMLDLIEEGNDFSDAAAAFCKEIIAESAN